MEAKALEIVEEGGRRYYRRPSGERYPSVTGVIQLALPLWEGVSEEARLGAARIGSEVHLLCAKLAFPPDGDDVHVDPEYQGYIAAWTAFRTQCRFRPLAVEHRLWSERLRVAGTVDAVGLMDGVPTVIDYTVGSRTLAKRLQTAAYEAMWKEMMKDLRRYHRAEVHLGQNGKFNMRFHTSPRDYHAFVGLLQFYRWLEAER